MFAFQARAPAKAQKVSYSRPESRFFPTLFGLLHKEILWCTAKETNAISLSVWRGYLEKWRIFVNETNAREWIGDILPFIDKVIPFINYFVILRFINGFAEFMTVQIRKRRFIDSSRCISKFWINFFFSEAFHDQFLNSKSLICDEQPPTETKVQLMKAWRKSDKRSQELKGCGGGQE